MCVVRVDLWAPGVDRVGGYSMCSSPTYLTDEGRLDLAVKYSDKQPSRWLHEQVITLPHKPFKNMEHSFK